MKFQQSVILMALLSALGAAAQTLPVDVVVALSNTTSKPYTLNKISSIIAGSIDLQQGLKYAGSNTLFAPTDAAFAALPKSLQDALSTASLDTLFNAVSYHVLPGFVYTPSADGRFVFSTALTPVGKNSNKILGGYPQTVNGVSQSGIGQKIVVDKKGSSVTLHFGVNNANVVDSIQTSNGIVHVVDSVLLPPQAFSATTGYGSDSGLTILKDAGVTIFMLTDKAWSDAATLVGGNKAALSNVVDLHIVPGQFYSTDFASVKQDSFPLMTYGSENITMLVNDAFSVQGAGNPKSSAIVKADILIDSGVVHVIDSALLPKNIGQTAVVPVQEPVQLLPGTTTSTYVIFATPTTPAGLPNPTNCPAGLVFSGFPTPTVTATTTTAATYTATGGSRSTSCSKTTTSTVETSSTTPCTSTSIPPYTPTSTSNTNGYTPVTSSSTYVYTPVSSYTPVSTSTTNQNTVPNTNTVYTVPPQTTVNSYTVKSTTTTNGNILYSAASKSNMASFTTLAITVLSSALFTSPRTLTLLLLATMAFSSLATVSAAETPFIGQCLLPAPLPAGCKKPAPFKPTNISVHAQWFVQDTPTQDMRNAGLLVWPRLGLIDNSTDRWANFQKEFQALQCSDPNAMYKLFFIMRHGQGAHNVAQATYGTPAWNAFFSKVNAYFDPEVTDVGISQTYNARQTIYNETVAGMPLPGAIYSSPLQRALYTALNVWGDQLINSNAKVTPKADEHFRENYTGHTCDRRRSITDLKSRYPQFDYSNMFSETDELWGIDTYENSTTLQSRVRQGLFNIFEKESTDVVSLTAHGGSIGGFVAVTGHAAWSVSPGGFFPVVLKAW
ncbi:hypothetical protein HDU76_012656 [Blyttiomyces sp. JEL0837]|nr:hypothetical protein HDU76_012656 [Blyttiomyces sp. JEL0837]